MRMRIRIPHRQSAEHSSEHDSQSCREGPRRRKAEQPSGHLCPNQSFIEGRDGGNPIEPAKIKQRFGYPLREGAATFIQRVHIFLATTAR